MFEASSLMLMTLVRGELLSRSGTGDTAVPSMFSLVSGSIQVTLALMKHMCSPGPVLPVNCCFISSVTSLPGSNFALSMLVTFICAELDCAGIMTFKHSLLKSKWSSEKEETLLSLRANVNLNQMLRQTDLRQRF